MSDEYNIGYRKPPKATQFKPGQSGNRKGRPKGARNAHTLLNEALQETVMITENGKKRKVSKLEIIFRQMVNAAAKGDARARQQLLPLVQDQHQREEIQEKSASLYPKEREEEILTTLRQRLLGEEKPHDQL